MNPDPEFVQRPSGLFVPAEKLPPQPTIPTTDLTREQWDAEHAVCPKCGNRKSNMETTCLGYFGAADPNRVTCRCGWRGACSELVAASEEA